MLDRADLRLYEEVSQMPPFQRKILVLIGTEGMGRRTLKSKLLNLDPDNFGATIPRMFLFLSIYFRYNYPYLSNFLVKINVFNN